MVNGSTFIQIKYTLDSIYVKIQIETLDFAQKSNIFSEKKHIDEKQRQFAHEFRKRGGF